VSILGTIMWHAEQDKAYVFRRKHATPFPPPKRLHERPRLNLDLGRDRSTAKGHDQDHEQEHEEVPIVFMSPMLEKMVYPITPRTPRNSMQKRISSDVPLTPLSPPPSMPLPEVPPTPSSSAPEVMTDLMQEVLEIMNGIMDEQHVVQDQDQVLREMTELVVIMQQEAEDLLALADLVEEYVEEVDFAKQAADIEDWVDDLDLGYYGVFPSEESKRGGHKRDDSAVGLEEDDDFHVGELRESVYREVPIIRRQTPDRKEVISIHIESPRSMRRDGIPISMEEVPIISTPHPKGKTFLQTAPSEFRDSGLELRSPQNSPWSQTTTAGWI
jgi:hypothetical protein